MKNLNIVFASALLSASLGVNAEIKPANNAELSSVQGQLALSSLVSGLDSSLHQKISSAKFVAKALANDHATDIKNNYAALRIHTAGHKSDLNTPHTTIPAHLSSHVADTKVLVNGAHAHVHNHVSDVLSLRSRVAAYVTASK